MPLVGNDRVLGFLNLWDERVPEAFASDEIKTAWTGLGTEMPNLWGDDYGRFVSAEIKRWAEVVKTSGAKLD